MRERIIGEQRCSKNTYQRQDMIYIPSGENNLPMGGMEER